MTTGELHSSPQADARGTSQNLAQQIVELQDDAWLAARVIRTLLRHVSPSDVFNVLGEGG
jgi:hypothetical protein